MLPIAVLYYKLVTTIPSIAVHILGGEPTFTPLFLSMSTSSCSGCWVVTGLVNVNSGFCGCHHFWCYKGIKPPLYGQQGSLFIWVGVFHIREVDICSSLFPTQRGTYPLCHPCLALLTMTRFCELSHQSQGSLSRWHLWAVTSFPQPNACVPLDVNSHVMLPVVFTHLLWMDVVDVHGRSCNFPINPPQGSLTGRALGNHTANVL